MGKKLKLSVASPGHFEALEAIIKEGSEDIYEIFIGASSEYIGAVRTILKTTPDLDALSSQVEYAHSHNIKINIIANTTCAGGYPLTKEGLSAYFHYLDKLEEMGVDSITAADPLLIELVSENFSMGVTASCFTYVDSPERAVFFENLGATAITIDTSTNRDFGVIEKIREATSCELKIIVNESCLYKCPFRYFHANLTSHRYGPGAPVNILDDYYHDRCTSLRIHDPSLIIKSGWVRPEDVSEYEKIGIDIFKIAGRTDPVNWIINATNAYGRRSYEGNLLDILDVTRELRDLFYIPNKELEGAIEEWKSCKKDCYKCKFCEKLANKVINVYSYKGAGGEEKKEFSSFKC